MNNPTQTTERFAGVDLAKVIAIFFVVVLHVVGYLTLQSNNLQLAYVRSLFQSISYSCIDLFALATGFLCITSKCKYSRIANLWIATVFWGLTMLLVCDHCLGYVVPWKCYFNAVLPVLYTQYWFFTAYFMLFLFIPFLNQGIKNMTKRTYHHLLVAIAIFFCGYSCSGSDPFALKAGGSFLWLSTVYLIGGYLRLYAPCKWKPTTCFSLAICLAFASCLRQLASVFIGFRIPGDRFGLISYTSPFTLVVAIMIFIGCVNMTYNEKAARFLKAISATTFGVYLIHVQPFVWIHVWCGKLREITISSIPELLIFVGVFSLVAFCGLSLLEYLRIQIFKWIGVNRMIEKIDTILKR